MDLEVSPMNLFFQNVNELLLFEDLDDKILYYHH